MSAVEEINQKVDEEDIVMSRMDTTKSRIIALAYFHRYGWIVAMLITIAIWPEYMLRILSAGCIIFSIWTLVGYKRKWRHIFCSYQNAYRQEMTPHSVRWHRIKKSDVYVVSLLFWLMGLLLLVV